MAPELGWLRCLRFHAYAAQKYHVLEAREPVGSVDFRRPLNTGAFQTRAVYASLWSSSCGESDGTHAGKKRPSPHKHAPLFKHGSGDMLPILVAIPPPPPHPPLAAAQVLSYRVYRGNFCPTQAGWTCLFAFYAFDNPLVREGLGKEGRVNERSC